MGKAVVIHAPQKWEHLCLTRRSETYLMEEANKEGQHGWELVNVLYYSDPKGTMAWTAFFKRPAVQQNSASSSPAVTTAVAPQAEQSKPAAQPSGFDLGGSEFELQAQAPDKSAPSGGEFGAG